MKPNTGADMVKRRVHAGLPALLALWTVLPVAQAASLVRPQPQAALRSYRALGRVETSDHASLVAPFGGVVRRVVAPSGTAVGAQALLLQLVPLTLQARIQSARAAVASARADLAQQQVLAQQKLITRGQLEASQARLMADRATLQGLTAALRLGTVRAPFAGTVRQVVAVGTRVARGQRLLRIEGSGALRIEVSLPLAQARRLRAGAHAVIRAGSQRVAATVYAVAHAADRYGLLSVYIAVPPRLALIPGQVVRVRLALPEARTAWLVPRATVVMRGGSARVYAYANGKAQRIPVRLLGVGASGVVVAGALSADTLLVASGAAWLRHDAPVSVSAAGQP
ncbi:MAG TPA: efflux RND transporter periplasmic adaptor subunit [Acidiferrobacteraceae bacterium]|nr:efflux RND transporter periplasmic adaptor subunit [Acidiferrobacteraceae bacterium]